MKHINTKARILMLDIETTPNLGWTWGKYEQNVIQFKEEGKLLCFAYKWYGHPKLFFVKKNVVKELWKLFNEADVIIAHNGDRFDIKKSNAFFANAGLLPPAPYKTIDTRKIAKRHFFFNSNKLDDLGNYLGLGRKEDTGGFELWIGCMTGKKNSWKTMERYNKQDVVLLEKVYKKLLPWITNHPDVGLEGGKCKNCASKYLCKRGFYVLRSGKYQRIQCMDCGAWDRLKVKHR